MSYLVNIAESFVKGIIPVFEARLQYYLSNTIIFAALLNVVTKFSHTCRPGDCEY